MFNEYGTDLESITSGWITKTQSLEQGICGEITKLELASYIWATT